MTDVLHTPLRIGSMTVRNRLYRAPVLEGAGDGPDAGEQYAKHFVDNAQHGVGMIIQGASCVTEEGRSGPGMSCVDTREKVMRFAPMVDAVHEEGAAIVLQLGHGGLYAIEAWHEPYASNRAAPLVAPSPVPWQLKVAFRGVPVHAMTTEEVHELIARYGRISAWAREAGYDAIQLGNSNAKLLDQFLSPFYNRRTDEFGGSLENRARILRLIRGVGGRTRRRRLSRAWSRSPRRSAAFRARSTRPTTTRCDSRRCSRSGASTRSRRAKCRRSPTQRCVVAACPTVSGQTPA